MTKGGLGSEEGKVDRSDGGYDPRTYRMVFPAQEEPRPFPVKGCNGQVLTRKAIRVNLWHRPARDTVVILE